MRSISFSSVLLFPLVIFFIMQYRIGPGDTPYFLFGLIFLLLAGNIALDSSSLEDFWYNRIKDFVLWAIIIIVLGSAFGSAIVVRHQTAPIYGVHDIILQQEAAIRYLVHGKNPYKETYFNTPLQSWHYSDTEINPALYHFVMEPFYLIFALPFYFLANHTIGYFDGRIPLLILFLTLLVLAFTLVKDREKRRQFVTLLAFNPAMLGYSLEGRSDIYMFVFMFAGLYLLNRKKIFWSGILFGLAFMIKQSIWPFLPLYVAYLAILGLKEKKQIIPVVLYMLKNLSGFLLTCAVFTIPFLLWDKKAFLDSTIYYLSGSDIHSYPISGYGFGMMAYQFSWIKNLHQYYPFTLWQIGIGLPVLAVLIRLLWKKPNISILTFSYGIFLFVFWYFSRYFNNSHLGFLSLVFLTAYFWMQEEKDEGVKNLK